MSGISLENVGEFTGKCLGLSQGSVEEFHGHVTGKYWGVFMSIWRVVTFSNI